MERLLNSLVAVALLLGGYIAYDTLANDKRVPVSEWVSAEALNSPIRAGDFLEVRITRKKVRDDCSVASSRQAIKDDGRVFDMSAAVSLGGGAGTNVIDWAYQTPTGLPNGNYVLRVFLTYTCPEFVWVTQQPDTAFEVIG